MKYASEGEENMYIPYMDKSAAGYNKGINNPYTSSSEAAPTPPAKSYKNQGPLLNPYAAKASKGSRKVGRETPEDVKKTLGGSFTRSGEIADYDPKKNQEMGKTTRKIRSVYDKYSGANILRSKGANKWVARGAAPTAVAALGAGGAYLYNRNKKTKAAADAQVAEDKASMTERFKKGYSEYSGANKIMRGGESLKKNNPKGGNYWSGAKRQVGKAMSNKFVAHGALPTALGAAGLGSAYAYNQYKKKNKSASLEAEIFNQTLLDINTETAFLEELAEWKEANFDFGY